MLCNLRLKVKKNPAPYRLMNIIARNSQGNCAALRPRTERVGPGPEDADMGFSLVKLVPLELFECVVLAVARSLVDKYRSPTIFPQGNLLKFTKDTATPQKGDVELRLETPLGMLRAMVPTTRVNSSQEWMPDTTRRIRHHGPVALDGIKPGDIWVHVSPRDYGNSCGGFSAKILSGDSVDGIISVEISGQSRYVSSSSFLIEVDDEVIEKLQDDAGPAAAL